MEEKSNLPLLEKLFNAQVHLGHRRNRLHPKARKYVYKIVNGTAIIDLTITAQSLEKAKEYLKKAAHDEKTMLFVGTKKIINQFAGELANKNGIPYIVTKWLPGLLTNFDNIMKNVKKLLTLEEEKKDGVWEKFVKHEVAKLEKEMSKLRRLYGGIIHLTKKPDVMFIVDIRKEKNALNEAQKNNIPVVAVLDTNSNPETVDYPVVANDDSATSLEYLVNELIEAYTGGKSPKK